MSALVRTRALVARRARTVVRAGAPVLLALVATGCAGAASTPPTTSLPATAAGQSPIDVPAARALERVPHRLFADYHATREHLVHKAHTLELVYDPGSRLELDGESYALEQLHFHTPSEHRVAGRRFPLEMHLVHQSDSGRFLVVGVLFDTGSPNAFLERLLRDAPLDEGRIDRDEPIDVGVLFREPAHFFAYDGSFTTPPYTEGVRWLILQRRPEVSADQVVRLLVLEGGNAREVQPLGQRIVEEF